jgi:hypothetical protein
MNQQGTWQSLALWIWPVILILAGILLLLQNYLLLEFDVRQLWPLLLVFLGIQAILSGGLSLSRAGQNFGITRGSVEAGTLRVNSGELDLRLQLLQREGRLIAGQYTARSRPQLEAEGNRAVLTMLRSRTWLLSLADWDLGLAGDLPWNLLLSSFLGQVDLDLRGLIVDAARISTGIGDLRVIGPDSAAGPITLQSTLGDIYLTVPPEMPAAVTVLAGPLFDVRVLDSRWQPDGEQRYVTPDYAKSIEPLEFAVQGTTGSLYLS